MKSKINLHPAPLALDGNDLDTLIEMYLVDCETRCLPCTVAGYRAKIVHFRRWWELYAPTHDHALTKNSFSDLLAWMETQQTNHRIDRPWSTTTKNDILRRLREMFLWARRENFITIDCASWVPRLPVEGKLRRAAALGAFGRVLDTLRQSQYPQMAVALYGVLLGTGVRLEECRMIDIPDIEFDRIEGGGYITIRFGKRVRGRSSRERMVAFDRHTEPFICDWLAVHPTGSGALFTYPPTGTRIAPVTMRRILNAAYTAAGVDTLRGCHDLRRAFITYWRRHRRGEAFDTLLKRQIGHVGQNMTSQYDLADVLEIKRALVSIFGVIARVNF